MNDPRYCSYANKEEVRKAVWSYMETGDFDENSDPGHGILPDFSEAESAARLLTTLPEWKQSRLIFTGPGISLYHVRCEALREGKQLLVATPCLTGFCLLQDIPADKILEASSIEGLALYGRSVDFDPFLPRIDLYITSAVAVDKKGNRISKDKGSIGIRDDELIARAGLIRHDTPRITLIHDMQLFDDFSHLMGENDRRVSIIVTPHEVWRIGEE